jgi:outer membrane protein TolC
MLGLEVGIALPLFASRRQDRGVDAGAAEVEAAVARRDAAREQWSAQVRADLARWHGLQRQLALHEDSRLPLARDRVAVALAAYRNGGEVAAWLDAQRELLALTRDTLALRAELGRAWVALAYLLEDAR